MSEGNNVSQAKKNWFLRHKIISSVLLLFVIIIVVAACSPSKPIEQTQVQAVFDVPSLMGKNVDEITTTLGKPDKDDEPTALQLPNTTEWWKTYKKDGYELLVTYNPKSRTVIDFFISAKSENESSRKDMDSLMSVVNVKDSAPEYSVEYVKALKDPSIFTGVKIVPKK